MTNEHKQQAQSIVELAEQILRCDGLNESIETNAVRAKCWAENAHSAAFVNMAQEYMDEAFSEWVANLA